MLNYERKGLLYRSLKISAYSEEFLAFKSHVQGLSILVQEKKQLVTPGLVYGCDFPGEGQVLDLRFGKDIFLPG